VILFRREIVEPRLDLKPQGIQRCLHAIVRMQMRLATRGWVLSIERAPAQEQRRSTLAGSYEKVASSNIARGAHVGN
jgi:hypothetical protein